MFSLGSNIAQLLKRASLISAYGQNGDAEKTLQLLHQMEQEGLQPTAIIW